MAANRQEEEEETPAFQTFAPSIFVPCQIDLTQPPPDLPTDPEKLCRETIAQIDEHANLIQDNIYYMIDREKTRIYRECEQREALFPKHLKPLPGLAEGEEQWLMDSTNEVEEILMARSNVNVPGPGDHQVKPEFTYADCKHEENIGGPGEPPRKTAEKMVMNLARHGVQNLEAFAQYTQKMKDAKIKELQKGTMSRPLVFNDGVAPADRMDTN